MRIRFWGTRGSIPTPGPHTLRYGGNTSCVEVSSEDGTLIVLDGGTGVHGLGRHLLAGAEGPVHGHLLLGHTHWDHIQGIPFFAPFYVPGNRWNVYGPRAAARPLRESLARQMDGQAFPIPLERLSAELHCHDIDEGVHRLDDVEVRAQALHHSSPTLGYRLEADGHAVVYACDHEPSAAWTPGCPPEALPPADRRHAEFLAGADLVIHDAQYTAAELEGKRGWGHSSADFVVDLCRLAGVRRLALTHHDPQRHDDDLDGIVAALNENLGRAGEALEVFAAAEGQVLELAG
jgi:phosphoribosyl 1,2-cyclic phosphodiesterase